MFSHRVMAELVIRAQYPEWADRVDFSTLEKWPTEQIGDRLEKRYLDLAWRCAAKDGSSDHLLLMEFQAEPQRTMALRTTNYAALAANEFLAQRKQGEPKRDLKIESLVLHHGDGPWNAPTRASDLVAGSRLDSYQVMFRRLQVGAEVGPLDLPALVLGIGGRSTAYDFDANLPLILKLVRQRGDDDFDRHVFRTLAEMLVNRGFPKERLEEAKNMETFVSAFQRSWDDRLQRGLEQGREEGVQAGEERILRRLAASKFGSAAEAELSSALAARPGTEQVSQLADAVLECDSVADFLGRVREVAAGN